MNVVRITVDTINGRGRLPINTVCEGKGSSMGRVDMSSLVSLSSLYAPRQSCRSAPLTRNRPQISQIVPAPVGYQTHWEK